MRGVHTVTGMHDESRTYAIRIRGHLDGRWASWFEGMTIELEENGVTLLTGLLQDQAALHGLMRKVRDLGLPLLSITPVEREPAAALDAADAPNGLDAQP